ncbi:MAG: hypothetical protein RIF33_08825 [Cyclobacteriaceae bacterium]
MRTQTGAGKKTQMEAASNFSRDYFSESVAKYDKLSYHRILNRIIMKVTALIPDKLIEDVKKATGGKNITESLIIALETYLRRHNIDQVINEIDKEPMVFREGFASYGPRKINRDR